MNVTPNEMIVVGTAVLLFAFIAPLADLRSRPRRVRAADPTPPPPPQTSVISPDEPTAYEASTASDATQESDRSDSPAADASARDDASESGESPAPMAAERASAPEPEPAPVAAPKPAEADPLPQTLTPPRAWPSSSGAVHEFDLFGLRDAGALARPRAAAGIETGADAMREVSAVRARIEAVRLQAPVLPASYSIVGVERAGTERRIVALLFEQLWPEGAHAATARALFELDASGAVTVSVVEPV